jgi:hypothetical protein
MIVSDRQEKEPETISPINDGSEKSHEDSDFEQYEQINEIAHESDNGMINITVSEPSNNHLELVSPTIEQISYNLM